MKTKHTKGEWQIEYIHEDNQIIHITTGGGYRGEVAVLYNVNNKLDKLEANAKLIAAAPDLLDALLKIREYLHHDDYAHSDGIISLIDEKIKKATL